MVGVVGENDHRRRFFFYTTTINMEYMLCSGSYPVVPNETTCYCRAEVQLLIDNYEVGALHWIMAYPKVVAVGDFLIEYCGAVLLL